jgi:hypothetical protein
MQISLKYPTSQIWQEVRSKKKKKILQWGVRWLNPTGKIILIKSTLSSLTIFQCATLLAPKGVVDQISKLIKFFHFEGGKTNSKKFQLVNWSTVFFPLNHGGLAIRDPFFMNLALGEKFVWRIMSRPKEWWKSVLLFRYSNNPRSRCLDTPLSNVK